MRKTENLKRWLPLATLGGWAALALSVRAQSNDPPCGNPPRPPPPSNCTHSASSNPFDIYSGSVGREVIDLEPAHSVGSAVLRFARYHASRWDVNPGFDLTHERPFGDGGNWRHRFQWNVLDNGTNEAGQISIRIVYPSGFYGNFAKTSSNDLYLTYLASTHERVREEGTNYHLIMLDGTRYHFTAQTSGAVRVYRMEGFTDPYDNPYRFEYADGRLVRVIGPNTNLAIELNYITLTNSQPPGLMEFSFADSAATQVLLVGTFNNWTGQDMTNNAGVWRRTVQLAEGVHEYKFIARYAGMTNDVWYSDPENPLYTLPYSNSVAYLRQTADTATVIGSVTGTDGRSVAYQYGVVWGTGVVHVLPTNVAYGDGSRAAYTYYHPSEDFWRRPLLATAQDPHYSGPARAVRYIYRPEHIYPGQIYEERHLETDQLLARLDMDSAHPRWRRVTYADGSQEEYWFGTNTGQQLTYTNAVGYSYRAEYFMVGDAEGMLWKEVDPQGRTTVYSRTWHFGAVTMISNSVRGVRRFTFTNEDEPFYLSAEVDEAGRTNSYQRDSHHRVTRRDYPDGSYETFTYNDHGQVLTHRRRDGGTWAYEYDVRGRKIAETDPAGATTTYGYDAFDRLAAETNALGHVTCYFYNWRGQVTNVIYPDGTEEITWYDAYGQVTQRLDRSGALWTTDYDELGHVRKTRDPLGFETHYQYDAQGRLILTSNAMGLVISNTYDAVGRRIRQTYSSDGSYSSDSYDPDGVRTQVDRLGHATLYDYDEQGRLIRVTDPLGRRTSYGYDEAGNRTHVTNALGDVTVYTYDRAGRITSIRDCSGAVVSNVYDEGGRLTRTIDPNDIVTSNAYDAAGRLVASWRGGQLLFSNSYNAVGWLVAQRDASGLVLTNIYDTAGRLLATYWPDGTFVSHSYSNTFLVRTVDRAGRQTIYQRDALGRITNQLDNAGHSVRFAYDAGGRLTHLWDQNGNLTRFVYDAEGRQTAKIYADNSQYAYGYDALGRLTSKLDAKGQTTIYHYDPAGNLTNIVYASDPPVFFEYDALNRRTRMVDAIGTTVWSHAGGCAQLTQSDGPFADDSLTYSYDLAGRLLCVSSAFSSVSYSYDSLDRITNVAVSGQTVAEYTWHGAGRLFLELRRANGTRTRYEYDALNRLTNLVHETTSGTVLASFAYTLDDADQRTRVVRGGSGSTPTTIEYGYDAIGQLISAEGDFPGYSFHYSYDPAGNLVMQDNNGFVLTNTFNHLNQNVTSWWGGSVTVLGVVNLTNGTVTVNGLPASTRADSFGSVFVATNLPVSAGTNVYTAVLTDVFGRAATSVVSVVAENRGFGYDANGNMTNDGQFVYE